MGALDGQVALVTGGSRGIGKGCALELAAAGALVYATGRTAEPGAGELPGSLAETIAEIEAAGGRAVALRCDHRNDDEVASVFDHIEKDAGRLDVLVNAAFIVPKELTHGLPFWETPTSNWDDMVGVGTRAAYVASQQAARMMVPRKRGLIANISSSGAREYAWHVAYGVGKAALDRLTEDTAFELREFGVAVVSLWPGIVLTERIQAAKRALETQAAKRGLPNLPFEGAESQRFTGRAVVALASDPERMARSGQVCASRELADAYGFTDIDGNLPRGPMHDRPAGIGR